MLRPKYEVTQAQMIQYNITHLFLPLIIGHRHYFNVLQNKAFI